MSRAATGGLTRMTSITAQTHATLDGVIDASPADALVPYMTDAGRQGALDLALAADALLLPRETWQGLALAWRDQTGPMAERLNAMPKYVVSATLGSADEWDHTTIVGYASGCVRVSNGSGQAKGSLRARSRWIWMTAITSTRSCCPPATHAHGSASGPTALSVNT